ncbi:flavin reductase family protein [Serratia fonticola]|uniref:flavin reductase family protein n=1 Tax=Serratia fonticola TaxID=47917 RepID=UPI00192D19AF|nr:flavin reductase family protein [Serratia fonticola]MBL5828651.1 flavin reductase family protein [Serratia fonticola]
MKKLKRKIFREFYQPSKVLLGVLPDPDGDSFNIITLCFTTTCSYKPAMLAISIEDRNYSYKLAVVASEMVLAVPGESLAEETMSCGFFSGRDVDKFSQCGFTKEVMPNVSIPGICEAIANIEIKIVNRVVTGDHITLFGEVVGYHLNESNIERNLLAIGPNILGYELLVKKGMHRLGVIAGGKKNYSDFFDNSFINGDV